MAYTSVAWDGVNNRLKRLTTSVAPDIRAGRTAVGSSASSLAVVFSTAVANTSYAVVCTWYNVTDSTPQFQPLNVTVQSTTGFTVSWNAPTDTANYAISWQATAFT